jgi:NitT/TauT family transport system ATP-binding protein
MKQRVSIARALSVEPQVLLMDEPFAALDAQNRALMQREMGRLLAEADSSARRTMVLVTHSIEEAILLSDRIVVLSSRPGRVKEVLPVDLPRPRDEDDPRFIALRHRLRALINEEIAAQLAPAP